MCDNQYGVARTCVFELTAHFHIHPSVSSAQIRDIKEFSSIYLNQLKFALCLRDRGGYQNFNRLSKDQILRLQSVAVDANSDSCLWRASLDVINTHLINDTKLLRVAFKLHRSVGDTAFSLVGACDISELVGSVTEEYLGSKPVNIICQGVLLPHDTPMLWLGLHAIYLDGFVHLTLPF